MWGYFRKKVCMRILVCECIIRKCDVQQGCILEGRGKRETTSMLVANNNLW